MKKKVFLLFVFLLLFSVIFVSAQNETTVDGKAYSCLQDKVKDKCSSLSTEEKIFSLLAVGECKSALTSDSLTQECWPSSGCKIKTTSQAVLALSRSSTSTKKAEDWLTSPKHSVNYQNIEWLLQVESPNSTSCTAAYSGGTYSFSLNSDKTLSGNPGNCLSLYQNYWFKVSSSCYNKEIKISCQNSFLTSMLYKKTDSPKLYISDETHSASGLGSTTEKASSLCFSDTDNGPCTYEGTLWAAIVLKYRGYNVSSYIPYLVLLADENSRYLPESFLYTLTTNYRTELLTKQRENRWWAESGDNFYDTAVALLPFQNEEITEKENSKSWLTEIQGSDGCWQGNIRNTAFLLYSIWPKKVSSTDDLSADLGDCEGSGYSCMSVSSCESVSGNVLEDYSGCFGTNKCCSKSKPLESCANLGGELCAVDNEVCSGGDEIDSSDSNSAKFCCVSGECAVKQASECENNNGICRSSCIDGEEIGGYSCTPTGGICCTTKKTNYVWLIILLIILIILTALGIIYRKQLKSWFLKFKIWFKSKFRKGKGKSAPASGGPRFPPSSRTYPSAVPRRIITNQAPSRRPSQIKSEFDDVLKKLKEIGK